MRSHGVVNLFPLPQFAIELFHLQQTGSDLAELLGVSPLGALDRAVKFGGARWQHKQMQASSLAGLPPRTPSRHRLAGREWACGGGAARSFAIVMSPPQHRRVPPLLRLCKGWVVRAFAPGNPAELWYWPLGLVLPVLAPHKHNHVDCSTSNCPDPSLEIGCR